MTWDGHLPHSGWELAGLLALLAFGAQVVGNGILLRWQKRNNDAATRYRKAATEDRETLKVDAALIRDQVVNGHAYHPDAPKLRDDMDLVKGALQELRVGMQQQATQSDRMEAKIDAKDQKIDRLGTKLDRGIDRLDLKIDQNDERVRQELSELKRVRGAGG